MMCDSPIQQLRDTFAAKWRALALLCGGRGWDIFVPLCRRESFNGPLCADCFVFKIPVLTEPPFSFLLFFNHWVLLLHNLLSRGGFRLQSLRLLFNRRDVFLERLPAMAENAVAGGKTGRKVLRLINSVCCSSYGNLGAFGCFRRTPGNMGMEIRAGLLADGSEWVIRLLAGHGTGFFT